MPLTFFGISVRVCQESKVDWWPIGILTFFIQNPLLLMRPGFLEYQELCARTAFLENMVSEVSGAEKMPTKCQMTCNGPKKMIDLLPFWPRILKNDCRSFPFLCVIFPATMLCKLFSRVRWFVLLFFVILIDLETASAPRHCHQIPLNFWVLSAFQRNDFQFQVA